MASLESAQPNGLSESDLARINGEIAAALGPLPVAYATEAWLAIRRVLAKAVSDSEAGARPS